MIQNIISKYNHKLFLIAYSGGVDSTVLLYQLLKIRKINPTIQIRAIHINHNINDDSKKWQQHCIKTCKKNNVPLIIEIINVKIAKNIEEQLRIKRYNLIYKNLLKNEILLTGHHLNDQCETFFLSLKRGSGPTGLAGISFEKNFGKNKIVRPLLTKTKKELIQWANLNKIKWIEDFSNLNIKYDRNFIRQKILPILEKKWPFFLKNCFRTTQICNEENKLKNILIKEKIQEFICFNECLNIKHFKNLKAEICKGLIRYWISLKNIKYPSYKTIQYIYDKIIYNKKNSDLNIAIQDNEIRCYKKVLYFIQKEKNIKNIIIFWHNTNNKLILPNHLGCIIKNKNKGFNIPNPKKNELINIRFQYKEKILILGKKNKKNIKNIWQEYNIPPWLRNQIPLVFYNDKLICALGVFIVNQKFDNIEKKSQNQCSMSWINNIPIKYYDNFFYK